MHPPTHVLPFYRCLYFYFLRILVVVVHSLPRLENTEGIFVFVTRVPGSTLFILINFVLVFTRVYNFLLRVCVHTAEVPMLCIYFRYGVWCH